MSAVLRELLWEEMSSEKGNRCNLHRRHDASAALLLFLITLDRVEFDGIKLKVSSEQIDRPRYITPGDEADDLSYLPVF